MAQSMVPVATWGLTVAPNGEAEGAFGIDTPPGTLQLTMAAIDPDEDIAGNESTEKLKKPRATVKMIILRDMGDDDEDEDEDDEEDLEMADLLDDDGDDDDEDSPNGEGPSDPKRSPKEMKKNALAKALKGDEDDVLANGITAKGKAKVTSDEELDDDEDDDEKIAEGAAEYVLCTLDPDSHYNQPLNITIPMHEEVAFRVTGTHSIHLTGNIVVSPADTDDFDSDTSDDEDVDLSPDEDELDLADGDDESDELDDIEDPRVTELPSEDEVEPPKLIKADKKNEEKSSKKRPREEDSSMLDIEDEGQPLTNGALEKALNKDESVAVKADGDIPVGPDGKPVGPDGKPLSKTQLKKMRKKMKDNAGNAITVTQTAQPADVSEKITVESKKESPGGKTKTVQFAEKLVEHSDAKPSVNGEAKKEKKGGKHDNPRTIDGITIDDRHVGSGPQAKKGDKLSMRYLGKLEKEKKIFDSNKKGPPFNFRLGSGQVIKGWDIGLEGMQVGGERRITVPPKHGYGSKKTDDIPANSTLVFDVKLLEINTKKSK